MLLGDPEAQAPCSVVGCHTHDFLPTKCKVCAALLCTEHAASTTLSGCPCCFQSSSSSRATGSARPCAKRLHCATCDVCSTQDRYVVRCTACQATLCLTHRYHQCAPDISAPPSNRSCVPTACWKKSSFSFAQMAQRVRDVGRVVRSYPNACFAVILFLLLVAIRFVDR